MIKNFRQLQSHNLTFRRIMKNEKSNNKWKQTNNEETFYIYFAEIRKVCQLMTFVNFYLNKLCLGHKIMIYVEGDFVSSYGL